MDASVVKLKEVLVSKKVCGIALDIDETLANNAERLMNYLSKELGNPEGLTPAQLRKKYRYTWNVPYWDKSIRVEAVSDMLKDSIPHESLPLIENSNIAVNNIIKKIPVCLYLTSRPPEVIEGTKIWLKKHNFPVAEIITKPTEIHYTNQYQWKINILNYLYPLVIGIVDDDPDFAKHSKNYKGKVWLYNHKSLPEFSKNVISCKDWADVEKKILAMKV